MVGRDDVANRHKTPGAKGTCDGVAKLSRDQPSLLFRNRPLLMLRVDVIVELTLKNWPNVGKKKRVHKLDRQNVCVQLCNWKRDGFGTIVKDLKISKAAG